MTKQIETIMALADEYLLAQTKYGVFAEEVGKVKDELRTALEAALKSGDGLDAAFREGVLHAAKKYAAVREHRFTGGDVALFLEMEAAEVDTGYTAAPPAQTPPRLTEDVVTTAEEDIWSLDFLDDTERAANMEFARSIETAVRRQFGVQE